MNLRTETFQDANEHDLALPSTRVSEMRLKKILVATDFSECSRKAFHYALSLGKQYHAEVIILHVWEPVPPELRILEGSLMDRSFREDVVRLIDEWRHRGIAQASVNAVIRDGKLAYKGIVAYAREVEADIVVIGNHGRNAIGRVLMGSTAEKVVRFAPCPVLVIREREHDFVAEESESNGTP